MLSTQDKERIYNEELYRRHIQQQLQQQLQRQLQQPTRRLFNSAFGVWLISALVIVAAAYGFSFATATINTERQQQQRIRQLDTELSARLVTLHQAAPDTARAVLFADDNNQPLPDDLGVYPQLAKRGFRSLLYELHALVPPPEQPALARALRASDRLSRSYRQPPLPDNGAAPRLTPETLASFNLARWQQPFSTVAGR